jgi:hypothetical protein
MKKGGSSGAAHWKYRCYAMTPALLAWRPDYLTDPLPCLFVDGTCRAGFPRGPVRFDLLQDHAAQPGENGNGNHGQKHGFRFLSHSAILVTV